MNITGPRGRLTYHQGKIIEDYKGWNFRMCPLALTGFSYEIMYGRFPRTKKIGHDTDTILPAL